MACVSKTDYKRRLRESPPEIFHTQHLQKTSVWQIYPLIFSINAVTAFFMPTFEATIPQIAGEQHYVQHVKETTPWANDDAQRLAGGLRAALDKVNVVRKT